MIRRRVRIVCSLSFGRESSGMVPRQSSRPHPTSNRRAGSSKPLRPWGPKSLKRLRSSPTPLGIEKIACARVHDGTDSAVRNQLEEGLAGLLDLVVGGAVLGRGLWLGQGGRTRLVAVFQRPL